MTGDTRDEMTGDYRADAPGNPEAPLAGESVPQLVLTIMRLFRGLERVQAGLTPQQYRILKLAGAGGERSARLAERLAVAKPTLTATADGLVAAGFARRDTEPGDRRVVRLCLTPAGRAAIERADAAYCGWLDRLLGATTDADQVLGAFEILDSALEELRCSRPAVPDPQHQQAKQGDKPASPVRHERTVSQPRAQRAVRPAGQDAP
jgi:DNA-binding MarR family transcriptional regulator